MKYNPCACCKTRNALPASKAGLCARCQEIVNVLNWMLEQERKEQEKIAKRKAAGLILPEDLRKARGR